MKDRVAYFEKNICGHFCLEPIVEWRAYDNWHKCVATGKTKKECVANARMRGYVVPKNAI